MPFITIGRLILSVPEFLEINKVDVAFIVTLPDPPTISGWLTPALNLSVPASTIRFPMPDTSTEARSSWPVPDFVRFALSTSDPVGAALAESLVPRTKMPLSPFGVPPTDQPWLAETM